VERKGKREDVNAEVSRRKKGKRKGGAMGLFRRRQGTLYPEGDGKAKKKPRGPEKAAREHHAEFLSEVGGGMGGGVGVKCGLRSYSKKKKRMKKSEKKQAAKTSRTKSYKKKRRLGGTTLKGGRAPGKQKPC